MKRLYDVIIIGDGVVGNVIAKEVSRYRLKVGVLKKNLNVRYETNNGSSGAVHGGFVYDTGSLKTRLCVKGNRFMEQLAEELDFKLIRCGKVLVDDTAEDMETLRRTIRQGRESGAAGLELVGKERLHQLASAVAGKFTMFSANGGIVGPFNYTIALAENTHANGAAYYFDHEVIGIRRDSQGNHILTTSNGELRTRWVVNNAGLGCGKVSDMLSIHGYKVIDSKGDYIILDKRTGPLLPMPVYPIPSNTYMGVHMTNATDGNIIIGPNTEVITDSTYCGIPRENVDYLAKSASDLWPCIHKKDYIRSCSGILPKWVDENGVIQDFKMGIRGDIAPRTINLVGIEFPGLTAAVPIARYTACLMGEREKLALNPRFNPIRKGIPRFAEMIKEEQEQMIRQNPDYGQVVRRYEKVTRAKVLTTIRNPLRVNIMAGIKCRTCSMMERYQGGYCQMRIAQMIKEESGKRETEVRYTKKDSQMFFGRVREEI